MTRIDVDRLVNAVKAIYSAGHWSCDRAVDEFALWDELKRAAGIPHGTAPKPFANTYGLESPQEWEYNG